MKTSSNHSKKNNWQKIGQQIRSFFQSNPMNKIEGEEIDYYHQYVFPKSIERMEKVKNKSTLSQGSSRRKI